MAVAVVMLSTAINKQAAIPIATALTVTAATLWPQGLGRLAPAGDLLGTCLLYVFFASAGAAGGAAWYDETLFDSRLSLPASLAPLHGPFALPLFFSPPAPGPTCAPDV